MQSGDGQIDRDPDFLVLVAKQKTFLRMEYASFLVGMTQALQPSLNLGTK
jgi:hypothetical protein